MTTAERYAGVRHHCIRLPTPTHREKGVTRSARGRERRRRTRRVPSPKMKGRTGTVRHEAVGRESGKGGEVAIGVETEDGTAAARGSEGEVVTGAATEGATGAARNETRGRMAVRKASSAARFAVGPGRGSVDKIYLYLFTGQRAYASSLMRRTVLFWL